MLQQLLTEIRTGGTLEVNSLATRIGTSPQMVHAMLEHLRQSGMITNYELLRRYMRRMRFIQ